MPRKYSVTIESKPFSQLPLGLKLSALVLAWLDAIYAKQNLLQTAKRRNLMQRDGEFTLRRRRHVHLLFSKVYLFLSKLDLPYLDHQTHDH